MSPLTPCLLLGLSYPCISLLIAAKHAETSGHDTFTFEMLFETFNVHVRMSLSAPVHVEGGGIGMLRCTRGVMIGVSNPTLTLKVLLFVTISDICSYLINVGI